MEFSKLRVLLFSPLPPPAGGIATWTLKYLDWCKEEGIDLEIINTAVIGRRADQINSDRSIVEELKRTILIIKDLVNKMNYFKPDVVHLNTPCGRFGIIRDYISAFFIKKYKIPLIVHYRCNIEDQIKDGKIQKYFLKRISKIANKNLVLNTSSKYFLKSVTGQDSELIANFIEDKYLTDGKKQIKNHVDNIVFIGHVKPSKGVREIIKVASEFPDIKFTLAGSVSKEIISIELPDNIDLKGSVDSSNVRELLNKADIFLFPTYTEGFSNALLEAMAMGLPIITTNVGANGDMIQSSGGILVKVKSCEEIVNAIRELDNKEIRQEISQWNINRVKENYLIDIVMNKIKKIYYSII